MSNAYKDVMREVFNPVSDELMTGFTKKMTFILENSPHSKKTVECCLKEMSEKPTLVELLAAAYLVNGGLLFKHDEPSSPPKTGGIPEEDTEYTHLLKEMEELNCLPSPLGTIVAHTPAEIDIFADDI